MHIVLFGRRVCETKLKPVNPLTSHKKVMRILEASMIIWLINFQAITLCLKYCLTWMNRVNQCQWTSKKYDSLMSVCVLCSFPFTYCCRKFTLTDQPTFHHYYREKYCSTFWLTLSINFFSFKFIVIDLNAKIKKHTLFFCLIGNTWDR